MSDEIGEAAVERNPRVALGHQIFPALGKLFETVIERVLAAQLFAPFIQSNRLEIGHAN